jgi:hypothetical protein
MMDEAWKLDEIDPGDKLDRRVRRRMRMFAKAAPVRHAAPFLPFERAVYAVVLAVYMLYTGARAVRVFQEARAPQVLAVTLRARSPLPYERVSCLSWAPRSRWWT